MLVNERYNTLHPEMRYEKINRDSFKLKGSLTSIAIIKIVKLYNNLTISSFLLNLFSRSALLFFFWESFLIISLSYTLTSGSISFTIFSISLSLLSSSTLNFNVWVTKFTLTSLIPSIFFTFSSIFTAQLAQLSPSKINSFFFMQSLQIVGNFINYMNIWAIVHTY